MVDTAASSPSLIEHVVALVLLFGLIYGFFLLFTQPEQFLGPDDH